ncbi:hypothetical protein [Sinomonas humi]|uniref:Uncharacterized protein n=1 Tax=Sinomonas humi TaxID=1338436 RepID=A0A0B2AUA8_9MICC|nr:hypothetical protein [Sinomonas humi]KHL05475.1 hypothetical protein LK10_00950 [Sinomonas humi]
MLNANIALYAATLLFVAAAALFLASAVGDALRLVALLTVTALFYATGLVVHPRVPRLRPAAVAFTGTGLALLPVSGLAVDVLAVRSPALTWFATSVLGLIAFGMAAVRLESRILVYASLTFAFSGAWSGAAALGGALAVDLAALLVLSAAMGVLALVRPRWIPRAYLRPVVRVHPLAAPAVLVAATIASGTLERWQYPALVAAVCASLSVAALVRGPALVRRLSWWGARATAALATASGFAQAADLGWLGNGADPFAAAIAAAAVTLSGEVFLVVFLGDRLEARVGLKRGHIGIEQASAVGLISLLAVTGVLGDTADGRLGSGAVLWSSAALLVAAQVVAWWHGRVAEWLPCAAYAVLVIAHGSMGRVPFAVVVGWGAVYWLIRARRPRNPRPIAGRPWHQTQLVAAARYASLLAVPAVVDACGPGVWDALGREVVLGTAFAGVAAAQLLLSALLRVRGLAEFGRPAALVIMSAAAAIGCGLVAVTATGWVVYAVTVAFVCGAGVALSAVFTRGDEERKRGALLCVAVPPSLLAVLAGEGYLANQWGIANSVLCVLTLVLGASALRLPSSLGRLAYVWLTRIAGILLALGVFHALGREGWRLNVGGQPVSGWQILAAVTLAQLCVPLAAAARRATKAAAARGAEARWALEDVTVTLGLATAASMLASLTEWLGGPRSLGLPTSLLCVGLTVGAATSGVVLRRRPAALALLPAVLTLIPVAARGDLRVLEIAVGVSAAYAAAMVYLAPGIRLRGIHLLAARALPLILAGLVAHDATASPTVLSLVFAVGLALQHAVRRLLQRTTPGLPFQSAAYWSALAAQLALPIAYAFTSRNEAGGGRWVLLVETALAAASAVATLREHPRASDGAASAAFLALIWLGPAFPFPAGQPLSEPLLSSLGFVLASAALAGAHAFGLGRWGGAPRRGSPEQRESGLRPAVWPWTTGGLLFASAGLIGALGEEPWVLSLALSAGAAVLVTASWVWRSITGLTEATFPTGVLGFLMAGIAAGTSVFEGESAPWRYVLPLLVGGLIPAGVGLALRWAPLWLRGDEHLTAPVVQLAIDPVRRWSLAAGAGLALILPALASWDRPAAHLLPALAAALVALVVSEVPQRWRRASAELGSVVVLAATQRAVFADDEPSMYWLVQWYVAAAAVIALLRYIAGDRRNGRRVGQRWLTVAAGTASFVGLVSAPEADAARQIWLLLVFVGLTVAGLAAADRRFAAWGGVGVLACVLWAVRAYPYLLLAALGLALVGAAVWWLLRASRGTLLR